MEELIEEYNELLRERETAIAAGIAAALDRYFRNLQTRILTELQSDLSLLEGTAARELELIPHLLPDESDELLQTFQDLLQQSTTTGLALAAELSKPVVSSPVAVTIPKAAVASQARVARRYLEEHSNIFYSSGNHCSGLSSVKRVLRSKEKLKTLKAALWIVWNLRRQKCDQFLRSKQYQSCRLYATSDRTCAFHCLAGKVLS